MVTDPDAMIVVRNLRKSFRDVGRGEIVAVDDVGFDCRAGEIFGLLGLNGAGKTTTLRILSTVLKPTAGQASIAGHDVVKNAPLVRRHIGFLSNNTALYDRMSAWEHVEYFGKLYAIPETELYPRMEEVFESLAMNDFREMLVSKMSTGMRQKVSIARTIVHDPPVLIFDEPTNGLDVVVARAVLQTVERLKQQNKCVIISTHIMRDVEKLCDRLAIVHRGRLLALGTLAELRDNYRRHDLEELFFAVIQRCTT